MLHMDGSLFNYNIVGTGNFDQKINNNKNSMLTFEKQNYFSKKSVHVWEVSC